MQTPTVHAGFMQAALAEAEAALISGEFPVGCVLVYRDRIVAAGRRLNSKPGGNELDHAEVVALRSLKDEMPDLDLSEVHAYSTMEPCLMCLASLVLSGIRTIVYGYEDVMGGATRCDLSAVAPLYASMSVTVVPGICRPECLMLFKTFFLDPGNSYWQDSPLARYTLDQP
jgi:tRNA(adenine34) deaminase